MSGTFVFGIVLLLLAVVIAIIRFIPSFKGWVKSVEGHHQSQRKWIARGMITLAIVFAILGVYTCFASTLVYFPAGQIAMVYPLNGEAKIVQPGHVSFISPLSKVETWDTTAHTEIFSQKDDPVAEVTDAMTKLTISMQSVPSDQLATLNFGGITESMKSLEQTLKSNPKNALDYEEDVYGFQTTDQFYVTAVSTLTYRIDPDRFDLYYKTYGHVQPNSKTVVDQLKAMTREALEQVILNGNDDAVYDMKYVMSNKTLIGKKAKEIFMQNIADKPFIIESFTIDDLVGPAEYEARMEVMADLNMQIQQSQTQQLANEAENIALMTALTGENERSQAAIENEKIVRAKAAEADATVKKIETQTKAENDKIAAEAQASVALTKAKAEADVTTTHAKAEADATKMAADADAEKTRVTGEAEAAAIEAKARAYQVNPDILAMENHKLDVESQKAWAQNWAGISLGDVTPGSNGGISFTNWTDIINGVLSKVLEYTPVSSEPVFPAN